MRRREMASVNFSPTATNRWSNTARAATVRAPIGVSGRRGYAIGVLGDTAPRDAAGGVCAIHPASSGACRACEDGARLLED
jgi:hypothetical protein